MEKQNLAQNANSLPTNPTLELLKRRYEGKLVTDALSPTGNWLGFTLLEIEQSRAWLSMPIRMEMTNPYHGIHGGMMGVLCDEAIGWAVVSLGLENAFTTINLNLDYLYAAFAGETIVAEGKVIREGKKLIHAEALVYNAKGQLLAKSTSNLVVTGMKMPTLEAFLANE